MEVEQLKAISEQLTQCVLSQDTTDYWDLLAPNCELRYATASGASPTASVKATTTTNSSGSANNASSSMGQPPVNSARSQMGSLPPINNNGKSGLGVSGAGGRSAMGQSVAVPHPPNTAREPGSQANNNTQAAAPSPTTNEKVVNFIPPGAATGLLGAKAVGEATARIFRWMQSAKAIAEPSTAVDARRKRKTQEQENNNQQHGRRGLMFGRMMNNADLQKQQQKEDEDPLTFSKVGLKYGRPRCMVEDTCYINEDGKIQLIVRAFPLPPDPNDRVYLKHRTALFQQSQTRFQPSEATPPVLDFSFCSLDEPMDLLRIDPRSGKKHEITPVEEVRPVDDHFSPAQKVTFDQQPQKILIKAKNRYGEEEAYEIRDSAKQTTLLDREKEKRDEERDALKNLAAQLKTKYVTISVRLSDNNILDATGIVPVLRSLVVNYYMSIHWLDLSRNKIKKVPTQLDLLPLTTLHLHDNHIDDWDEVDKLRDLPRLQSVTLFQNPVATITPEYKLVALSVFLTAPNKEAQFKSLDFVPLSKLDYELTTMHRQFHSKDSPRTSPRNIKRIEKEMKEKADIQHKHATNNARR